MEITPTECQSSWVKLAVGKIVWERGQCGVGVEGGSG